MHDGSLILCFLAYYCLLYYQLFSFPKRFQTNSWCFYFYLFWSPFPWLSFDGTIPDSPATLFNIFHCLCIDVLISLFTGNLTLFCIASFVSLTFLFVWLGCGLPCSHSFPKVIYFVVHLDPDQFFVSGK